MAIDIYPIPTGENEDVFEQMFNMMIVNLDLESMMIDSTFIRVHQHGAGAKDYVMLSSQGMKNNGFVEVHEA